MRRGKGVNRQIEKRKWSWFQTIILFVHKSLSQAKSIGRSITVDYYPHDLSCIKTSLATRWICIFNKHKENRNYNFKPKIAILKNLLSIWKQRTLYIKGNITIANILAMSRPIYASRWDPSRCSKPGPQSSAICGAVCALSIAIILYETDPLLACWFYLYYLVCFCFNTWLYSVLYWFSLLQF